MKGWTAGGLVLHVNRPVRKTPNIVVSLMLHSLADSRRLYLILAVWVLVCGLAAFDLCDLSDELLQPLMVAGVVAESEIEALDDDSFVLLRSDVDLRRHGAVPVPPQSWSVLPEPDEQRAFPPLYLQASQYRI